MDELKKYLQQNREELDTDQPSPALWDRIREAQEPIVAPVRGKIRIIAFTRWAAAACILVLAGIGVKTLFQEQGATTPAQEQVMAQLPSTETKEPATTEEVLPLETLHETAQLAAVKPARKVTKDPARESMREAERMILKDIEQNFTQVINLQRNKVNSIPMFAESAEYFRDFKVEINQLEKEEKQVKNRIGRQGLNESLLTQLINIYQQKLNTLKSLQTEMNKLNNRFKQVQNPVDSVHTYFIHI